MHTTALCSHEGLTPLKPLQFRKNKTEWNALQANQISEQDARCESHLVTVCGQRFFVNRCSRTKNNLMMHEYSSHMNKM